MDLVPSVQFKKREEHSSMGIFQVFKILQMVPNRAKHHKFRTYHTFRTLTLRNID